MLSIKSTRFNFFIRLITGDEANFLLDAIISPTEAKTVPEVELETLVSEKHNHTTFSILSPMAMKPVFVKVPFRAELLFNVYRRTPFKGRNDCAPRPFLTQIKFKCAI